VVRLTVSYGCAVSNGTQGMFVALRSPTAKVAAPMKTETTSEFMGRQFNDIVNYFVSPFASGTSCESQFDRRTTRSVKSNTFPHGVELKFGVVLNQFNQC